MKTNSEFWNDLNSSQEQLQVKTIRLLKDPDLDNRIKDSFSTTDQISVLIFFESLTFWDNDKKIRQYALEMIEIALSGNETHILHARKALNLLSKDWLLVHIEYMAAKVIFKNLKTDGSYWLYMRLLELYDHLGFYQLIERLLNFCANSSDRELKEIAIDHVGVIPELPAFSGYPLG